MPVLIDYAAIKAAKPMRRVLEAYGLEVSRGVALCPFHADSRPSMRVYDDGFYCFSCGAGGDTVKWVARYEGISNSRAARKVAELAGLLLPEDGYRAREALRRRQSERRRQEREGQELAERYDRLCRERRRLTETLWDALPYGEEWADAARRMPEIEGDLDELYGRINAAGMG